MAELAAKSTQMVGAAAELRSHLVAEQAKTKTRIGDCLTGARTEDCVDAADGSVEAALRERANQIASMDEVIARFEAEGARLATLLSELRATAEGSTCDG